MPRSVYPVLILNIVSATWKDDLSGAVANKLYSVTPILGDWQSSYRPDEVVLCRARIGHIHLNHSYKKEVYYDNSPHFGGVQSRKERCIWQKRYGGII